MSDYPRADITADVIVFAHEQKSVLLIKRARDPYKDMWALPGGFFNPYSVGDTPADTSIAHAAWRELREETGLDVAGAILAGSFKPFDEIGRDPRGRVVTFVYFAIFRNEEPAVAQDDAKELRWFPALDILEGKVPLAFDHQRILSEFLHKP